MGVRRGSSSANVLFQWIRKQSIKVKIVLAVVTTLLALVALRKLVKNQGHFFVVSEFVHAVGILVLIYKLTKKKTCSGLSLKSQELTAIFLAVRLCCSLLMNNDIHTLLDFMNLVSTLWVVYMIRYKLHSTYIKELDNMSLYKVVVPCAILAILVHPYASYWIVSKILWAFCVYLEAVSVLPQLRLMQNAKMVEPFTSHYVFALGISRFLGCAHWIFQIYESGGTYLMLAGKGYLWIPMIFISEFVQTFILADFCYYYVKSVMDGQLVLSLRSPV